MPLKTVRILCYPSTISATELNPRSLYSLTNDLKSHLREWNSRQISGLINSIPYDSHFLLFFRDASITKQCSNYTMHKKSDVRRLDFWFKGGSGDQQFKDLRPRAVISLRKATGVNRTLRLQFMLELIEIWSCSVDPMLHYINEENSPLSLRNMTN